MYKSNLFYSGIFIYFAGFFAVIGHIFPIWFRFKGGKGVATASGFILTISPFVFILCAICFISIAIKKKIIAVASIFTAIIFPFLLLIPSINFWHLSDFIEAFNIKNISFYAFNGLIMFIICAPLSALIIYKHKSNILKLREEKLNKEI